MNTSVRIKEAMAAAKIRGSDLARLTGATKGAVSQWVNGIASPSGENLLKVSRALGVTPDWLLTGKDPAASPEPKTAAELIASDPQTFHPIEPWDSSTPLDEDDVEIPLYTETQLSAGNGSMSNRENQGPKLRFSRSTLRRNGVQHSAAICVGVTGNSMEPILPDGCTIGVDTSQTTIRDGKMYALRQGDLVRVKLCYRLPMGGLRLRSYNRDEYDDEDYSPDRAGEIEVIGRVFWSSVMW